MNLAPILLIISIPFGIWLSQAASDEISAGKKWFALIILVGLIGSIYFGIKGDVPSAVASLSAVVISGISLQKTFSEE